MGCAVGTRIFVMFPSVRMMGRLGVLALLLRSVFSEEIADLGKNEDFLRRRRIGRRFLLFEAVHGLDYHEQNPGYDQEVDKKRDEIAIGNRSTGFSGGRQCWSGCT
jgi:hypothetical protein